MIRSTKIPHDRVGSIIGKGGETKKMLEDMSGLKLDITEDGEVSFDDEVVGIDPLRPLQMMDVIKAIARGFNPDKAIRLFEDDEYFEFIDLKEAVGERSNQLSRVRGRIIGRQGKTRQIIEDLTGCYVSVYGSSVCIIGNSITLPIAKHAVELLVQGSEHATVYHYLESQRPRLRIAEMGFDI